MKKLLPLLLALSLTAGVLAACQFPFGDDSSMASTDMTTDMTTESSVDSSEDSSETVSSSSSSSSLLTSSSNSTTSSSASSGYTYNAFTAEEQTLIRNTTGATIPFLPTDTYFVEEYSYDFDYEGDSYTEVGVNYYTIGNTSSEFYAYKSQFTGYEDAGTYLDDEGYTWYYFDYEGYSVEMIGYDSSYGYIVDVYA